MHYLKFSILIWFIFTMRANAFEDQNCLKDGFNTQIERAVDPFGLFNKKLKITKEKCEFIIETESFKYLKEKWIIDICRTPVHIKKGIKMVDVLKRGGHCEDENQTGDYCKSAADLLSQIQDEGLIFAKGQKENLSTDHGKFYCSYLLFKKYLYEGIVFDENSQFIEKPEPVVETVVEKAPEEPAPKEENTQSGNEFPGKIESVDNF